MSQFLKWCKLLEIVGRHATVDDAYVAVAKLFNKYGESLGPVAHDLDPADKWEAWEMSGSPEVEEALDFIRDNSDEIVERWV